MWGDGIARTFALVIVAYFVFALANINNPSTKIQAAIHNAAGAMTSLGILGTFTGIFVGLLDFNIANINQSVPNLLNGLKIAFGTSILGLFGAVVFRITRPFLSNQTTEADDGLETLIRSVEGMREGLEALKNGQAEKLDYLADTIEREAAKGRQDAATNNSEIKATLVEISNDHKQVFTNFNEQLNQKLEGIESAVGQMAQTFAEGLIEQLENVIREFNERLSEQFGENFARLNEAVGNLLTWQDNYKAQLTEMKEAFEASVQALEDTSEHVQAIAASAQTIPDSMERFNEVYGALTTQVDELEQRLQAFSEMRQQAIDAFPVIQQRITEITDGMAEASTTHSAAVESFTERLNEASAAQQEALTSLRRQIQDIAEEHNEAIQDVADSFEGLGEQTSELFSNIREQIQTAIQEQTDAQGAMLDGLQTAINTAITGATQSLEEAQADMLTGLQTAFNETISNATQGLENAVQQLDEAMQEEIGRIVTAMAENLSGITQQFVNDYEPLMQSTRQVLQIAQVAQRDNDE